MYAYIMLTNNCFWAYTISTWPFFASDILGSYNSKACRSLARNKSSLLYYPTKYFDQHIKLNKY